MKNNYRKNTVCLTKAMSTFSQSQENILNDYSFYTDSSNSLTHQEINIKEQKSRIKAFLKPVCRKYHQPIPVNALFAERLKYAFLCPPSGIVDKIITQTLIILLVYAVLWSVLNNEAEPGGNIFALFIVIIFSLIGGWLIAFIKLPSLLGMLAVGIALRNIPQINIGKDIKREWADVLRSIALVIILTRAGLGLNSDTLKKSKRLYLCLSFIPNITEVTISAVAGYFLLSFTWLWGFLLGFVLTAVSPAVIIPEMLLFQQKHLGTNKGIPTIIMATTSLDNVFALCLFSILLGIAFSKGQLVYTILQAPLAIIIGIAYGVIFGYFAWYVPNINSQRVVAYRFLVLFLGGLFSVFGSKAVNFNGAGPIGCLIFAFIAGLGWRKDSLIEKKQIEKIMSDLWVIFQAVVFGLIGSAIDISKLEGRSVGLLVLIILVGIIARLTFAALSGLGSDFTKKEKLFIVLANIPKATVQATIGSVALDTAMKENSEEMYIRFGNQILAIAVLSILITAPIGAIAISWMGPKLLTREEHVKSQVLETEDIEIHL